MSDFKLRLRAILREEEGTDSTPEAFSFIDVNGVGLSATITSTSITVAGIDTTSAISISGGTYNINGGSYTASSGTVVNGDVIRVRLTSSGSVSTGVSATLTIGGVSDTFTATTSDGMGEVLIPDDFTLLKNYRLTQQLGGGGTGQLADTGPAGAFWKNEDGTIDFFMMGQNYEGYATRYPLIQFRIDPTDTDSDPTTISGSTPQMEYIRDWGEFRDGCIISAAGDQSNYVNGTLFMEAYPGDDNKRILWWNIGDGYVPNVDYPTLSCSILDMTTHAITSYGPWRGDVGVGGRRFLCGQIFKLPDDYVAANCPGFSKAIIGIMGSGLTNSPFGPSIIAIEDFDPETLAPCTGTGQAANFDTKFIIHHDSDHKKSRATDFQVCRWDGGPDPTNTTKYACQYGFSNDDPLPEWGGVDLGSDVGGAGETDTQQAVAWINTPTKRGVLFFCKMNGRPPGGVVDPHMGYAKSLHVSDTGGGAVVSTPSPPYFDKACCHGFFDPEWGSTGPFSTSRRPKILIYDPEVFADSTGVGGSTDPWDFTPTTEAFDMFDIHAGVPTALATSASDYPAIFGFGGSTWFDEEEGLLYIVGGYDFVTDTIGGARLPHIMVFEVAE